MKNALHSPKLGLAFSVIITLTFAFVFNSVQSNTIAQSLNATFHLDTSICGIVLAALTAIIIFGGLKRIFGYYRACLCRSIYYPYTRGNDIKLG